MIARPLMALVAASLALSGCAGVIRDRIYQPDTIGMDALDWTGEMPRQVSTKTADGLDIQGYYFPPTNGSRDILVFFHGNGGSRHSAAKVAQPLAGHGPGILIADYRGYGGNPGSPSEKGLFADGAAFIQLARQLQPGGKLYLFGWSLGGAVALEQAARTQVDGVVTLGTFTRLADMAPALARGLLPDRFDNLSAIKRVSAPVFLFHGDADQVVPYAHAARLSEASGGQAPVVTLRGADHHLDFAIIAPHVWAALEHGRPPQQ